VPSGELSRDSALLLDIGKVIVWNAVDCMWKEVGQGGDDNGDVFER
jgi:hypothetical protein